MPDEWFDIENIAPWHYLDPVTRVPIKGRFVRVFCCGAVSLRVNATVV